LSTPLPPLPAPLPEPSDDTVVAPIDGASGPGEPMAVTTAAAHERIERPGHPLSRRAREALFALAVLAPSAVIFSVFFFYPLYRLVHLSVYRQNTFGTAERYVGPSQLGNTLTGDAFTSGLRITITFVAITVPLGLVLGTLLAVAAHRRLKGIRVFQTIFSSTIASSVAVSSVVFFVLINPQVGYFSGVGFFSLADPDTALRGVAISSVWQNLGLTFVIVLAGLQALPDEVLEAATLDGFGPVRRFFRIIVPLLSPTLLFLLIVLVIFGFQAFGQIDILTSGGPARSTETLVFKIFNAQQPQSQATGAGLSLGLFGVTLVVTLTQFLLLERRVHYAG
jgi:sn-glycerol 3-phosphate transport system permease protein